MVDASRTSREDFKTYQFVIAIQLVHELAHVLITYMQEGLPETPDAEPFNHGVRGRSGEAGWFVERLIFGGVVDPLPDTDRGMPQVRSRLKRSFHAVNLSR